MFKFFVTVAILLFSLNYSFTQIVNETFFKDAFLMKVVDSKKAKFKVVEIQEESNKKRKQIINLKNNCLVKEEFYQEDKPVGVWITNSFTDCSLIEKRDFSKLVYKAPIYDSISDDSKWLPNNKYEPAYLENDSTGLFQYIIKNIKYPDEALDNKIQGSVMIQFKVNKDGKVEPKTIFRSGGAFLDYATWELIESMPKFSPFKVNGIPMDSYISLPVNFMLD